jgi:hypothetical protein
MLHDQNETPVSRIFARSHGLDTGLTHLRSIPFHTGLEDDYQSVADHHVDLPTISSLR